MLMGIALLVAGVFFNPPPIFKSLLQTSGEVQADSEYEKPLLTGRTSNFKIVINVPATELRFFEDGELIRRIPVAVGQARYPTPIRKGDKITYIVWNPWWIPPESGWAEDAEVTPPGPHNPLGVVKMPLDNAVLLHGTDKPWSVGTPASHSCIRMYNEDARSLAWTLQANLTPYFDETLLEEYAANYSRTVHIYLSQPVPVEFIYEPIEIEDGELNLHRDLYWRVRNKKKALLDRLLQEGFSPEEIDMNKLEEVVQEWQQGKNKIQLSLKELTGKST